MTSGYEVDHHLLRRYILSVRETTVDAELARDAAREIANSYDLGAWSGINVAYGVINQVFGGRVQRVYDLVLPLLDETVDALGFVADQLEIAADRYQHVENHSATQVSRAGGALDDVPETDSARRRTNQSPPPVEQRTGGED